MYSKNWAALCGILMRVEIHNGFVHGHGKGRFSKISELSPIVVKERSVMALYVTIKSNQMLCSELPLELGAPLYSNDDLKISVGANIKVFLFYGSPMDLSHGGWNGYLEYRLECVCVQDHGQSHSTFIG